MRSKTKNYLRQTGKGKAMVAKVYTGTTNGIEGILVCVEADISD